MGKRFELLVCVCVDAVTVGVCVVGLSDLFSRQFPAWVALVLAIIGALALFGYRLAYFGGQIKEWAELVVKYAALVKLYRENKQLHEQLAQIPCSDCPRCIRSQSWIDEQ